MVEKLNEIVNYDIIVFLWFGFFTVTFVTLKILLDVEKSSSSINVKISTGFMQLQWYKSKFCLLVIFFYFDLLSAVDTDFNFILTITQAESCVLIEDS